MRGGNGGGPADAPPPAPPQVSSTDAEQGAASSVRQWGEGVQRCQGRRGRHDPGSQARSPEQQKFIFLWFWGWEAKAKSDEVAFW